MERYFVLVAFALAQVFIDYNISGMSYVHLRNALFLQPLPELSSVPSSERQHCRGKADPRDVTKSLPLTGIFTASTVPESLVANPLGQGATGWSPAAASAHQQTAGTAAGRAATARGPQPVTLQGDTEEVCWGLSVGCNRGCRCAFRSGTFFCGRRRHLRAVGGLFLMSAVPGINTYLIDIPPPTDTHPKRFFCLFSYWYIFIP